MGKSVERSLYFKKHIENQPTAELYLAALAASPYRTHRRMAEALISQYQELKETHENSTEEV